MWNQPGDSSRYKKWLEKSKVLGLDFFVCGGIFFVLVFLGFFACFFLIKVEKHYTFGET